MNKKILPGLGAFFDGWRAGGGVSVNLGLEGAGAVGGDVALEDEEAGAGFVSEGEGVGEVDRAAVTSSGEEHGDANFTEVFAFSVGAHAEELEALVIARLGGEPGDLEPLGHFFLGEVAKVPLQAELARGFDEVDVGVGEALEEDVVDLALRKEEGRGPNLAEVANSGKRVAFFAGTGGQGEAAAIGGAGVAGADRLRAVFSLDRFDWVDGAASVRVELDAFDLADGALFNKRIEFSDDSGDSFAITRFRFFEQKGAVFFRHGKEPGLLGRSGNDESAEEKKNERAHPLK